MNLENIIHSTAIIEGNVRLGSGNVIGPYCIFIGNINIGDGNIFSNNVVLKNNVSIGNGNEFFEFSSIGNKSQDKECTAKLSEIAVKIGDKNIIREYVTIHAGTEKDKKITIIGNKNLFMANAHIAHDCLIGHENILANSVALGGHVVIGNKIIIGGNSAVRQKVYIGDYAMIGGLTGVKKNVIPCSLVHISSEESFSVNIRGLKRNMTKDRIDEILLAFKKVLDRKSSNYLEKTTSVKSFQFKNQENQNMFSSFFDLIKHSSLGVYV